MALFQPTNIIPSSFTVGVVDASRDIAQISWQVNGNSAMTAYQIDFYTHDSNGATSPKLIASTDKTTAGIPSGGFFGTDRFGQPQMFTWVATDTWAFFNAAFKNGGQYKFKITQYWNEGDEENSITQFEYSVFNTKSTPLVNIYLSDISYASQESLKNDSILTTSIGYFKAAYSQEQGDAVRWVRWQVATATYSSDQVVINEILSDTGNVNTPTLQFEFNGFFDNEKYAIRCLIESESGQQALNSSADDDGWILFSIDLGTQEEYEGEFTAQCLPKENATLLSWTNESYPIPATVANGSYTLSDGAVTLTSLSGIRNASISWYAPETFETPWTAAIGFELKNKEITTREVRSSDAQTHTMKINARGLIISVQVAVEKVSYSVAIAEDKKSCDITFTDFQSLKTTATITLNETPFGPTGYIANFDNGGSNFVSGVFDKDSRRYSIEILQNASSPYRYLVPSSTQINSIVVVLSPTRFFIFGDGQKLYYSLSSSSQQTSQKEIAIFSAPSDLPFSINRQTFNCVTVYKGALSDELIERLYSDVNFKPSWDASEYQLYMSANFQETIDAGRFISYRIYRQEIGSNSLSPICYTRNDGISQLKDYGIVSRKAYTYWLYEYDKNNAFLKGVQCTSPTDNTTAIINTSFKNYSLLVCDYDSENDAYHVRKQYLFALNLSTGGVSNNNSPTLNANFTAYPTRMPSTQNYASGTLQGLIGVVYTVPALIEQIGGIKHLARPSTLDYFDDVDLEKELYDLSVAPYQLFLRDMKGHLRMVSTNGAISMTTNLKQRQQSISISLPWVEIGDASDVTIIQTPDDYGWNNDNQVLDVRLDVDPQSGVLSAVYPKPYNGTKFYLTGVHKETLGAETPVGVTPAKFNLSETASKPEDGILTATVNINSEEA